jgi:cytochrome c oxidase subunit IV
MKRLLLTWLALLVLLGATVGIAELGLGPLGLAVSLLLAAMKALLIAWRYMHLADRAPVVRIFAAAPLLWVVLLLGFVLMDGALRR